MNPQHPDESVTPSRLPRNLAITFPVLLLLVVALFFAARAWTHHVMRDSLPQLDGSLSIPGLSAPVTVQRDALGIPHLRASNLDDLILAQGYVTAQDRLWQMETLRRHATGHLAELLGSSLIQHDRTQRTLQLTAAADRAIAVLPPDQLHWLQRYAQGVNDSIAQQLPHLPLEFRLLHFQPEPWTPRDSLLVSLVMFQDLSTGFPTKLTREAISSRLPPELLADLYPVGSWRDHPPTQPTVDLTAPQENIPDVPLDESQSQLTQPSNPASKRHSRKTLPNTQDLLALQQTLAYQPTCDACIAGSNNWVVSGAHTASGKPLLSNDMHLSHGVPGIWYEASLESPTPSGQPFHVTGVTLPGTPFIIVGHNDHIAWGFTNLGADVQDVYVERTRGSGDHAEFQSPDGSWHPITHHQDVIHVRFGRDVTLDLTSTQHGTMPTPIISNILGPAGSPHAEPRTLALRWTIYDPSNVTSPFLAVNSATDWSSLCAAFSTWGGPAQNMVFADDQGHIGYHAVGRTPLRGRAQLIPGPPSPLSPVPVSGVDPAYDWSGYIPFDQLPHAYDPPAGILATANARVTTDDYPYPITLNWADPYRNERIWKVLTSSPKLTPTDMLHLQTDVYSDVDHVIAQRLAYAIDHASARPNLNRQRLRQAADILRNWNGSVDSSAVAPNIVDATRAVLWPMILKPRLGDDWSIYAWGEKTYAEEQIIMHAPPRWLPRNYANWDDLLASAVDLGLTDAQAPADLTRWLYGPAHPVDIEHPVFSISPLLQSVLGVPTGTGPQPQSGNSTTVKQVGRAFGPSERFTADLASLDQSTLNLVLGQSGNPLSPWFMDQWSAWYNGTTFPLPYTAPAIDQSTTHTLTLTPQ
jgi:penicillin amidase